MYGITSGHGFRVHSHKTWIETRPPFRNAKSSTYEPVRANQPGKPAHPMNAIIQNVPSIIQIATLLDIRGIRTNFRALSLSHIYINEGENKKEKKEQNFTFSCLELERSRYTLKYTNIHYTAIHYTNTPTCTHTHTQSHVHTYIQYNPNHTSTCPLDQENPSSDGPKLYHPETNAINQSKHERTWKKLSTRPPQYRHTLSQSFLAQLSSALLCVRSINLFLR